MVLKGAEKLESYTYLTDTVFGGYISPNWEYALAIGYTKLYKNGTQILNYYVQNNVCVINSGTKDEGDTFCIQLIKDIMRLDRSYDRVVISSSNTGIEKYMNDNGYTFYKDINTYERI